MRDQHVRLLRAAVVSGVILSLSAAAHVMGGGMLPPAGIILGFGAVTMLAVTAAAGHAVKFPVLAAVLGGGQFVLHHAFALLSTAATCVPAAAHLHHGAGAAAVSCIAGPVTAHGAASGGGAAAAMLAAHLLATLVTAAVIARGEEALHTVALWLRPLFALLQSAVLPPLAWVIVSVQEYRLTAAPFLVSPPLRGPPAFH